MRLLGILFLLFFLNQSNAVAGEQKMESLTRQLEEKAKDSKSDPERKKIMDDATEALRKSDIIKSAKKVGDTTPDFSLQNTNKQTKSLSELIKNGPVVLTFYRGGWCPYCNIQLRAYQNSLNEFTSRGATLVAVSPEIPDNTLSTAQKNEIKYEVLSDIDNKVAKQFGLVFSLPEDLKKLYKSFNINLETSQHNDRWELPIPATYVIDNTGKIVYSFLDVDYKKRADPAEIIAVLEKLKKTM